MSSILPPLPGPYSLACIEAALPVPSQAALRRLRSLLSTSGLAWDAHIGMHDQGLAHCVALPDAGILLTATQASAPLLQQNCVAIAELTGLHVVLFRFGEALNVRGHSARASACLIWPDPRGHLLAQEGYQPEALPEGGLLLRHYSPGVPSYLLCAAGMFLAHPQDVPASHLIDHYSQPGLR